MARTGIMSMNALRIITLSLLASAGAAAQTAGSGAAGPRYVIAVEQESRSLGSITVELFPDVAPLHVKNFDSLVSIGFYNGTAFHRVLRDTLIQGGDPNSRDQPEETWGYGDPNQEEVPAEFSDRKHVRGILSAARRLNDVNSATSQFFILMVARPDLDGRFSIYGQVVDGMSVVDSIGRLPLGESSRPAQKVSMTVTKVAGAAVPLGEGAGRRRAEIRPNPCSAGTSVFYSTALPGRTTATLHDGLGRPVAEVLDRYDQAGEHVAIVDVQSLPPGAYSCVITTADGTVAARIAVVR